MPAQISKANVLGNTIEKFTPGGVGSVFASSGLSSPTGLAFDSAENLYAANGDSTVEKFTPEGVGSLFASSGLSSPEYLAFTDDAGMPLKLANQVPEPSSLALGALATLRLCMVRRRSLL